MTVTSTELHVQRVSRELARHPVLRPRTLSPDIRGITFSIKSLADFVNLSFDDPAQSPPSTDGNDPVWRDYTPRRFDPISLVRGCLPSRPFAEQVPMYQVLGGCVRPSAG